MNWLTTAKRRSLKSKRSSLGTSSVHHSSSPGIFKSIHMVKGIGEPNMRRQHQEKISISTVSRDVLFLKKSPGLVCEIDEPPILSGKRCNENGVPIFKSKDEECHDPVPVEQDIEKDEEDLDWLESLNQQIISLKNPDIVPIEPSPYLASDLRRLLEKLYQMYQERSSKIASSPSNLLQIIRTLEIQLKHRLLTGNSPHEDSPLDSLILTQYERNDETTSSEFNQDKGTKLVVDECQNEDMVEGGYGLEESKEEVYYDIDNWNLFGG